MLWDQKRKSKIAQMRESFEAAKLEDCTFKPEKRKRNILSARSRKTQHTNFHTQDPTYQTIQAEAQPFSDHQSYF